MSARALMIMGTGSDVGKSLIVAGLCRFYARRGLKVMPFKPQNMSNNASVTADGGEIGRAQALQARAANQAPTTAMNPILLKPEHESSAQVIVQGKRVASMSATSYFSTRQKFMPHVLDAFDQLCSEADLVLVEGAGSASEINLRQDDIANFGFARAGNIPTIIVGDIQTGGVIASLVGTLKVIDPKDAALIVGTMVNKFHGDPDLFVKGVAQIEQLTGLPCFGPIPFFEEAAKLPAEDILGLETKPISQTTSKTLIVVPRLPRIANFDDFDPIKMSPGVRLEVILPGNPLPAEADLIILPGSKSTRSDLEYLQAQGWDIDIKAHARRGKKVLGICAGYQMLGHTIADPDGIEGPLGTSTGLGLLDVHTILSSTKQLKLENARDTKFGCDLRGYHMHMGRTVGADCARPFALQNDRPEGAICPGENVMGTYLHGVFAADDFRTRFLCDVAQNTMGSFNYDEKIENVLNELSEHLDQYLDLDNLLKLAKYPAFEDHRK